MKRRILSVASEENGYALYIVVVISFIMVMIIGYQSIIFVQQKEILQLQEMDVRTRIMVDSALLAWKSAAEEGIILDEIEVDHGHVTVKILEEDEEQWKLEITSSITYAQSRHQVRVTVSKENLTVTNWRDL